MDISYHGGTGHSHPATEDGSTYEEEERLYYERREQQRQKRKKLRRRVLLMDLSVSSSRRNSVSDSGHVGKTNSEPEDNPTEAENEDQVYVAAERGGSERLIGVEEEDQGDMNHEHGN